MKLDGAGVWILAVAARYHDVLRGTDTSQPIHPMRQQNSLWLIRLSSCVFMHVARMAGAQGAKASASHRAALYC